MNGLGADLNKLKDIALQLDELDFAGKAAICPPAMFAGLASEICKNGPLKFGGQDCHAEVSGAFTGDLSAESWKDVGADYVIVGHSERREYHAETNQVVQDKASAAIRASLVPIICIGETLAEREAGETLKVLETQIRECVPANSNSGTIAIGYEPVWAIGTGRTPTSEQIQEAHAHIRACLTKIIDDQASTTSIVYGGSMKPGNADEILALNDVDGGLIGGASLNVADFVSIITSSIKAA